MQWAVWSEIERILEDSGVKPLLAVVPNNQDVTLQVAPPEPKFWDRVRRWQSQGWTIGLHGYQHRYVTQERGIIGINNFSEFAGVPREDQERKLRTAVEIFQRERVRPDLWIAPGHSFDTTTLAILKKLGIRVISDGLFFYPGVDSQGMMWIPQQLCHFRLLPFGVWTICFHCNGWTEKRILKFRQDVDSFREQISSCEEVIATYKDRPRGWIDSLAARGMLASMRIKQTRSWRALRQ